jgi:hypothetical protein
VAPPPRSRLLGLDLDDEELDPDNRFDPRPLDEGSPARIIATMVGIVGILLLGSLFWSALGALFGAFGAAREAVPTPRPAPVLVVTMVPSAAPTLDLAATPRAVLAPTPAPASTTATPQPTVEPTAKPTATAVQQAEGRAPWILQPQPAPGTRVPPGAVTIEARGRGDAAIKEIRLELDGAALPASLEQRGDSTWRGSAATRVTAGQHAARAVVVDEKGRSGSYRWTFDAGS